LLFAANCCHKQTLVQGLEFESPAEAISESGEVSSRMHSEADAMLGTFNALLRIARI